MMSREGKVVCVTGASGFIASWIVKFLLQHAYTVRATVCDPGNPKKVDHLLKLDGAKEMLQLFKADLLEEGFFDSAIEGCDDVFHTTSPVLFVLNDPQIEMMDPAVKGTLNVLKSCAKSPSVKRVVFTSSIIALAFDTTQKAPGTILDETWFSNPDFCKESKLWYALSKNLAEAAAWEFVRENNIDMVAIHPGTVLGPLLHPDQVNGSVQLVLNIINGQPFPNKAVGWCNVKDVAEAHINAYEIASSSGRYLLAKRVAHYSELASILHNMYPSLKISDKCDGDGPYLSEISKEIAKSLGIEFTPLEVSLKETVESFKEKEIVNF